MSTALAARGIRSVLLDIEGTTTPIAFVRDVLFPYARARLAEFINDRSEVAATVEVAQLLAGEHAADLAAGQAPPPWLARPSAALRDSLATYAAWLMDRDRKSPGLKLLQGLIWERGYRAGELRGQVFDDVPAALGMWQAAGLTLAIYSSGSELAQQRLFESTEAGDLTRFLRAFFDTRVGAKIDAASYTRIAAHLRLRPAEVLFVSDVTRELAAARSAGLEVALSVRPGNPPQSDASGFEAVSSLLELQP